MLWLDLKQINVSNNENWDCGICRTPGTAAGTSKLWEQIDVLQPELSPQS